MFTLKETSLPNKKIHERINAKECEKYKKYRGKFLVSWCEYRERLNNIYELH